MKFALLALLLCSCLRPPQRETTTVVVDSLVTFPPASVSLSQSLTYDALSGFTPVAVTERQGRAQVYTTLDSKGNLTVKADCDEQQVLIKKIRVNSVKQVPLIKDPWWLWPALVTVFLLALFVGMFLKKYIL
jgi:hypothetical protein